MRFRLLHHRISLTVAKHKALHPLDPANPTQKFGLFHSRKSWQPQYSAWPPVHRRFQSALLACLVLRRLSVGLTLYAMVALGCILTAWLLMPGCCHSFLCKEVSRWTCVVWLHLRADECNVKCRLEEATKKARWFFSGGKPLFFGWQRKMGEKVFQICDISSWTSQIVGTIKGSFGLSE
jgi:hypothetical protein